MNGVTTLSIMTFSIMTLSMMTLSIMVERCYTVSFLLPVVYAECRKLSVHAEWHHAACHYVEYRVSHCDFKYDISE